MYIIVSIVVIIKIKNFNIDIPYLAENFFQLFK